MIEEDEPYALAALAEKQRRLAMLTQAHIEPLSKYLARIKAEHAGKDLPCKVFNVWPHKKNEMRRHFTQIAAQIHPVPSYPQAPASLTPAQATVPHLTSRRYAASTSYRCASPPSATGRGDGGEGCRKAL